jgi:hypothetical protein
VCAPHRGVVMLAPSEVLRNEEGANLRPRPRRGVQ